MNLAPQEKFIRSLWFRRLTSTLNSRLIQYLILFGAICVELMVYRRGIADSLIYIRGGESFLAGVNPYLQDSRFMSGPSGSGFVALGRCCRFS